MSHTHGLPGTPGLLRSMNDRTALTLLLDHGPLTRARLGELSGLSKPTASQVVARLEQAGLISAAGQVTTESGSVPAAAHAARIAAVMSELAERAAAVRASGTCAIG